MKKFGRWALKMAGWRYVTTVPEPPKSVICVAPHTSNWDFILGKLYYWAEGRDASFLMKKSWFFFPVGNVLRRMGGVPVDRSHKSSVTRQVVDMFLTPDRRIVFNEVNTIPGFTSHSRFPKMMSGIGLENVRQRLRLEYGDRQKFTIERNSPCAEDTNGPGKNRAMS